MNDLSPATLHKLLFTPGREYVTNIEDEVGCWDVRMKLYVTPKSVGTGMLRYRVSDLYRVACDACSAIEKAGGIVPLPFSRKFFEQQMLALPDVRLVEENGYTYLTGAFFNPVEIETAGPEGAQ